MAARTDRPRSIRKAARERYRAIAAQAGLHAPRRLAPVTPSRLEQIEASPRAAETAVALAQAAADFSAPKTALPPARAGCEGKEGTDAGNQGAASVAQDGAPTLTARVRALYEDGTVPVRELARLCGVSERTLYKYAARGGWRPRRSGKPAMDTGSAQERGPGGRFRARGEDANQPAGLMALDPQGAGHAAELCLRAQMLADAAHAAAGRETREQNERADRLRRAEARVRTLSLMVRALGDLDRAAADGAPTGFAEDERGASAASGEADPGLDELRRALARRLDALTTRDRDSA